MKYLKYFTKNSDYQSFMGGNVILPNVSFVQENNYIGYKPYIKPPLIKAMYNNEGEGYVAINDMDNVKRLWVDGMEIIFEPLMERNTSLEIYNSRISGGYDWYSIPSDYYLNDDIKSVVLTPMNKSLSEVEHIICASYSGNYWDFFDVNNTEYFIKDETTNSVSIKQSFFEKIFEDSYYNEEYDGKKKIFVCLGKRSSDMGNANRYDTLINYIGISGGVPKRYTFENNDIPHNVEIELKDNYIGDMFCNARGLINIELPNVITESNFSFRDCRKLSNIIFNAPKITCIDVESLFYDCFALTSLDLSNWDTSNVVSMDNLFSGCFAFDSFDTIENWDVHNVTSMYSMFSRSNATSLDLSKWDISKVEHMDGMFDGATSLTEVKMGGNPSNLSYVDWMFRDIWTNGIFYYNNAYDYSKIISELPSTWTAIPLCNNIQCSELKITADNVSGRQTNAIIAYTATMTGTSVGDGSMVTWTKTGTGISNKFEQNVSETNTRDIEVSFTYYGMTATTIVTQGVWKTKGYDVVLNKQWQLSMDVPNPDSSIYDGVYESFSNKGIDDSAAFMNIDIVGYETFKFYVRSDAESSYDYVVVSNLDAVISNDNMNEATIKMTTQDIQNSGITIDDYRLVEFTNIDGGEHRITVMYRKDGSSENGADRGYVLIPRNQ